MYQTNTVQVGQPWEYVLFAQESYKNPYQGPNKGGVDVTVTFSNLEEKTTTKAFWDGENRFVVRNIFPSAGSWTLTTQCSNSKDLGLHDHSVTVQVKPYEGSNPLYKNGMIKASSNNRYLTFANGKPFFYLADTFWFGIINCTMQEWKDYIDDRAKKNFNVVMVAPNTSFNLDIKTFDGISAQLYSAMTEGEVGGCKENADMERWNPEYYRMLDEKIRYANESGIIVLLNGLHTALINIRGKCVRVVYDDVERYGEMIAARYNGNYVIYSPSFDREDDASYDVLAEGIRKASARNLIGLHPNTPRESLLMDGSEYSPTSKYFMEKPYSDVAFLQSGHNGGNYMKVCRRAIQWTIALYKNPRVTKPVVNIEAWYENELKGGQICADHQVRMTAYQSLLSGSMGYGYGAAGIWNKGWDNLPEFYEALSFPATTQLSKLYEFLQTIEWWKLEPAMESIQNNPSYDTDEDAWFKTKNLAIASDRSFALAYRPYLMDLENVDEDRAIRIDMRAFDRQMNISWLNPKDGTLHTAGTVMPTDTFSFVPPDDSDWVLFLN